MASPSPGPDRTPDHEVKWLTPLDIAHMLGLKQVKTVTNWLKSGKLKGKKLPNGLWRIHPDDYKEFLDNE